MKKNRITNQLASLVRRDYFYLDAFWRVNLGMYIISGNIKELIIVVLQLASVLSGHAVIIVSLISKFLYDFDNDKQIYANRKFK